MPVTDAYQVLMDLSSFTSGAQKVAGGLTLINGKFQEITNTTVKFNSQGKIAQQTFTGIATTGEKLALTLDKVKNGWQITNAKMTEGVEAERKYVEAKKAAIAALAQFTKDQKAQEKALTDNLKANIAERARAQQYAAQQYKLVKQEIKSAEDATNSANASTQGLLLSWRSIVRFFEARLLYNTISEIGAAIGNGVKKNIEFSQTLAQIRTLTPTGDFNDWAASIKRVSNELGTDALDTAKGYYSALSNQIGDNVSQIESFTRVTAQFAKVTGSSAEQANSLFSAAINSFRLNAGDASQIAGKFFKAIDLGRITAEGMSGSFGRVAAAAGAMGISLDETLAAMAVLSKAGVSDADAMTQLLNMFNKLLKPTEAMSAQIKAWGYESGQSLIATEGFTGVLKRLNDELATKGSGALAKELGDLRAIRGGLFLTGKGFQDYKDVLGQVTNSTESYNRATEITTQTTGFRLQKQLQELNNTFLTLGETIGKLVIGPVEKLGGLSNIIKVVAISAAGLVPMFLLWGTTIVGVVNTVRNAFIALRVAIMASNPLAFIAGLAASIGAYVLLSEDAADRQQRKYGETLAKLEEQNKSIIAGISKTASKALAEVDRIFNPTLQKIAGLRASLNDTFENLSDIMSSFRKRIGDIAEADFRGIEEILGRIRDKISELKSVETKALADLAKDTRKASIVSFDDSIEDLPVFQRAKKIQEHIDELVRQAAAESAAGKFADAQGTLEEIRQNQQRFIQESKAGAKELAALESQNLELKKSTNEENRTQLDLHARINNIENQRALRLKTQGRGKTKKTVGPTDEQVDLVDTKALEQISRYNESLTKLDAQTSKYKESEAELKRLREDRKGLDVETAIADQRQRMADISKQILKTARQQREEADAALKAERDKKALLEIQYDKLKDVTSLGKDNPLFNSKDIKTADQAVAKLDEIFAAVDKARKEAGLGTNLGDIIGRAQLEAVVRARALAAFTEKEAGTQVKDIEEQKRILKERIDEAKQAAQNALSTRTELAAQVAKLNADFTGYGDPGDREAQRVNKILNQMRDLADETAKAPENIASTQARFVALVDQLQALTPELPNDAELTNTWNKVNDIKNVFIGVYQANQELLNAQKEINTSTVERTRLVNDLKVAYDRLAASVSAATLAAASATAAVPQDVIHKASGGQVYGSDKVPALLSPGEFVMNAGASRKFASQLIAMNSGSRNYNGGGQVSNTNVGDIHVSMSPSGNQHTDVVALARLLKREIRRGTVKL